MNFSGNSNQNKFYIGSNGAGANVFDGSIYELIIYYKVLNSFELKQVHEYLSNKHKYEGHNLMHLRTSFTLEKGLRLYLRINNLKDKLYAERADFNVFGGERYFPGIPRQTFIGLEYNF